MIIVPLIDFLAIFNKFFRIAFVCMSRLPSSMFLLALLLLLTQMPHVGSAADEVLSAVADVHAAVAGVADVYAAVAFVPGIVGIVAVACFPTFATVPDLAGVPRVVFNSPLLLVLLMLACSVSTAVGFYKILDYRISSIGLISFSDIRILIIGPSM
jgi:hypothetical protein